MSSEHAAIAAGTDRKLTFSGVSTTTIPAGAVVVSDPVALSLPAFADVAIDLYLPDNAEGQSLTGHRGSLQTSFVVSGNHAGEADWRSGEYLMGLMRTLSVAPEILSPAVAAR